MFDEGCSWCTYLRMIPLQLNSKMEIVIASNTINLQKKKKYYSHLGPYFTAGYRKPAKINTLRSRNMADISQTTYSNAVLEWLCVNFYSKFHWFIPRGPININWGLMNNILALVQIMTWRRPGVKPLSERMMFILQTHICVTQPQ